MEAALDICPDIDSQQDDIRKTCERLADELVEQWRFRREWLDECRAGGEGRASCSITSGLATGGGFGNLKIKGENLL